MAYKTFSQLYNDGLLLADELQGNTVAIAKTLIKSGINEAYSDSSSVRDWNTLFNNTDVSTVSSTEEYTPITSSSTICRIRRIDSIVDKTTNKYLYNIDLEQFIKDYPDPSATGSPILWYVSGYDSNRDIKIKLYPIPDAVYTLNVKYYEEPLELTADGDIPRIPDQYHSSLVYLGLAKYFEYQKDSMANYYRVMHDNFVSKLLSTEYDNVTEMPSINPLSTSSGVVTGKIGRVYN